MAMENISLKEASNRYPPAKISYAEKLSIPPYSDFSTFPSYSSSNSTSHYPRSQINPSKEYSPPIFPSSGASPNTAQNSYTSSANFQNQNYPTVSANKNKKGKFQFRVPTFSNPKDYEHLLSYPNGQPTKPSDGCALGSTMNEPSSEPSSAPVPTGIPNFEPPDFLVKTLYGLVMHFLNDKTLKIPPDVVNSSLSLLKKFNIQNSLHT
jgi:hypothetical protein